MLFERPVEPVGRTPQVAASINPDLNDCRERNGEDLLKTMAGARDTLAARKTVDAGHECSSASMPGLPFTKPAASSSSIIATKYVLPVGLLKATDQSDLLRSTLRGPQQKTVWAPPNDVLIIKIVTYLFSLSLYVGSLRSSIMIRFAGGSA